jgi:hypothetical protein
MHGAEDRELARGGYYSDPLARLDDRRATAKAAAHLVIVVVLQDQIPTWREFHAHRINSFGAAR